MLHRLTALVGMSAFLFTASAQTPPGAAPSSNAVSNDTLNAVLWQQTAAEHTALCLQAWRSAHVVLPRALKDKTWTAAMEQQGQSFRKLKPAIIVDIDETILDNGAAQGRALVQGNGLYDHAGWVRWTAEAKAPAVAGAREFLAEARRRGVTVFYVTNRGKEETEGTRKNLESQGFPVVDLPESTGIGDSLLLVGEEPDWVSDKSSRRALIAKSYRVIMLCGDDLNDFFSAKVPLAERAEKTQTHREWWGERWIVLPNAMYGSWENAVLGYQRYSDPVKATEAKRKELKVQ